MTLIQMPDCPATQVAQFLSQLQNLTPQQVSNLPLPVVPRDEPTLQLTTQV